MKKAFVLIVVLIMLAIVPVYAQSNPLEMLLESGSASLVYAQSIGQSNGTAVIKLSGEVATLKLKGTVLPLNIDLLGIASDISVGIGFSTEVGKFNRIVLGVGYLPCGYKWSFYAGYRIL
jgi:hypothetical protein